MVSGSHGSRLPQAVFVSRYQPRAHTYIYIGAGSDVYSIQEVHVARVSLVLVVFLFFFYSTIFIQK